jgi:hypothetical protein
MSLHLFPELPLGSDKKFLIRSLAQGTKLFTMVTNVSVWSQAFVSGLV